MKLNIETLDQKQSILIVSPHKYPVTQLLRAHLTKYNAEVFFSPHAPSDLSKFDYCFFINVDRLAQILSRSNYKKAILIFMDQPQKAKSALKNNFKNIKIISITGEITKTAQVDNLLWFAFSPTKECFLSLFLPTVEKKYLKVFTPKKSFPWRYFINKKSIIWAALIIILLSHFAFLLPLTISSCALYKTSTTFRQGNLLSTEKFLKVADTSLSTTKKLYSFARPILLLFSIALVPDNFIDINEKAYNVFNQFLSLSKSSKEIFKLILKKEKTSTEKTFLSLRIAKVKTEIEQLEDNLYLLNQKIPSPLPFAQQIKQELSQINEMVAKIEKIVPYLDTFLGKDGEKKYLLLFANNRELRPGGGFIGSFAIMTCEDLTLKDIKIYDAYDADGQLVAHIEPPPPIKKYLNIHWFLRDSAFSPDFLENYAQAKFFLGKEMNLENFSGGILITTTAIENLLSSFGDIYIPDFNEVINYQNFYLKTQIHAEKDFFPGSIQKKSFLASLTRQILLKLEEVSLKELIVSLKQSLDEKQIVVFLDEPDIQNVIDSFYWSGRVTDPQCNADIDNCVIDYLFPYDANLGVNKANFSISRQINLRIKLDADGNVFHSLSIKYLNESPADIFPGGKYRNYFQLLLPRQAVIKKVTKNDILVEDFDETTIEFKKVGFLFDVLPKSTAEIKIDYQLENSMKRGKGVYQLIVQKQIGSSNNDLALEITLHRGINIVNQNFTPLVKNNLFVYNTTLSADKIFFMELVKD